MVRVAGLKQQMLGGVAEPPADGMTAGRAARGHQRARARARRRAGPHLARGAAARSWRRRASPSCSPDAFSAEQRTCARKLTSRSDVFPALTPLAVDPGHPFPHLRNRSLNIAVLLRKSRAGGARAAPQEQLLAVVQVPSVLRRLVTLPSETGQSAFALLERCDRGARRRAVPGLRGAADGALPRHAQLGPARRRGRVGGPALNTIQEELRRRELRRRGAPGAARRRPRTTSRSCCATALKRRAGRRLPHPTRPLQLQRPDGARRRSTRGPSCASSRSCRRCRRRCATRRRRSSTSSSKGDILLHHPYESFDPVVRFIDEAADDPNVLAIKHDALPHRAATRPFVRALSRAAENGKQVDGARRDQGALRRGQQHRLGAPARGERRARGLRPHRLQDPLQGGAGGAARGRRHPPLRAPRHRQLQPARRRGSTPTCRT